MEPLRPAVDIAPWLVINGELRRLARRRTHAGRNAHVSALLTEPAIYILLLHLRRAVPRRAKVGHRRRMSAVLEREKENAMPVFPFVAVCRQHHLQQILDREIPERALSVDI